MKTAKITEKEIKPASIKDKPTLSADKFAVIQTGGKQYLVKEGDTLKVEKLTRASQGKVKAGGIVEFDKILISANGKEVKFGEPFIEGGKVMAKIEEEGRAKKVITQKYKPKTRYRVKKGHRQFYTKINITSVS